MSKPVMNFCIDDSQSRPFVAQLQDQVRSQIKSQRLRPGDKLPSFRAISRECQVSVGTVKQALNTLTAEGYLRSHPGRGVFVAEPQLKRKGVALVLPTLETEGILRVMRGVKLGLAGASHRMFVQAADMDFDQELDLFDNLDASFVAGAVIYPPPMARFVEPLQALGDRGVPYVLVNTCYDELDAPAVVTDALAIGKLAVEHLLLHGHRQIGMVDHTGDATTHRLIRRGMHEALVEVGLTFNQLPRIRLSVSDQSSEDPWANGRKASTRLLEAHPKLTAVIGINEAITMGVLQGVQASRRQVPDDVSVLSFGDLDLFSVTSPKVTCIRIPHESMGRNAAVRLSAILDGSDADRVSPTVEMLSPELIVRASVATLR